MDDNEVSRSWEELIVDRADTGMEAAVPLQVPNRVWLNDDKTSVCWSAGTERIEIIESLHADPLVRVARLHLLSTEAAAEEVVDLVAIYGPLGLCRHGLPAGHLPPRVIRSVQDDLDDLAVGSVSDEPIWWQWQPCSRPSAAWVPYGGQQGFAGSERLADWLRTSREAAALIAAGAATRRLRQAAAQHGGDLTAAIRRPGTLRLELGDLVPLDRLLTAPLDLVALWTDETDPDGHRRLVREAGLDRDPIGPMPGDSKLADAYAELVQAADTNRLVYTKRGAEAVGRELERITQMALQHWLDDGDLRVRLIIDRVTGEAKMRWGNGGLFSVIAMQMALTVGGIHALGVCDACRRAFRPDPWPNVGGHMYCDVCRTDRQAYARLRKQISRQARWPSAT